MKGEQNNTSKVCKLSTVTEVAHRGLHDKKTPENTLAACEAAINKGYSIEIDVMVLDDGEVIVFHDRTLDRMTRGHGTVRSRPYEELKRYEVAETEEGIPRLKDVCDLVAGRVILFIDLKSTFFDMRADLRAVRTIIKGYHGTVVFTSFDPGAVAAWESKMEKTGTCKYAGQIFHGKSVFAKIFCIVGWVLYNKPGTVLLVPKESVNSTFVQRLRRQGRKIFAWTITSPTERHEAYKYADSIIFDRIGG